MERDPGVLARCRRGSALEYGFEATTAGEGLLRLGLGAPDADWSIEERACAVVQVAVDGRPVSHVIVPTAEPVRRSIQLGHVGRGQHALSLSLAHGTAPGVRSFCALSPIVDVVPADHERSAVLRHAPILHGRTTPHLGSAWQNALTDSPLLAWHEEWSSSAGNRFLEYSVLWSNEDEGTSAPGLMARWGRTTDIEWVYRVEVDARGTAVPATAVFHGPHHRVLPFDGAFEGEHPLLRTATGNNMVTDRIGSAPMRFALGFEYPLRSWRARESMMRRHPWTYRVMQEELVREGRIGIGQRGAVPDPRQFLYLEAAVGAAAPHRGRPDPGLAFVVRLAGDHELYRTDGGDEERTVSRTGVVSSAVALPPGATPDDVIEIAAVAHRDGPQIASFGVRALHDAFVLDEHHRPVHGILPAGRSTGPVSVEPAGTVLWRRNRRARALGDGPR